MIIQYGPSSVEVLKPDKADFTAQEMQEILNEVTSSVHYYIGLIVQQRQAMSKIVQNQQQQNQKEDKK